MEPSSSQRMSACTQQGPTVRNPFYRFHTLIMAGWLSRCNHEGYSRYSKMEFAVVILSNGPSSFAPKNFTTLIVVRGGSLLVSVARIELAIFRSQSERLNLASLHRELFYLRVSFCGSYCKPLYTCQSPFSTVSNSNVVQRLIRILLFVLDPNDANPNNME